VDRIDAHLGHLVLGRAHQLSGHGRRRQSGRLGILAGQGPSGERPDRWLGVAQGQQHAVAGRGRAQPGQRVDRAQARRKGGVGHEREELGHRRVVTEAPGLVEQLRGGRGRVVLRQRQLPAKHAAEEFPAPVPADLGERGHRLRGGRGVESRQPGEPIDERLHRGGVTQETERERRRDPDRRIPIGHQREDERSSAEVADPSGREHGDPANQRIGRHERALEQLRPELARVLGCEHRGQLLDHRLLLRGGGFRPAEVPQQTHETQRPP
jgi:hypothetical protein